ncbi:MAG: carboxypeptidase M32 [Candidatus Thermoplasmatota archaeon]
MKESLKFVYQQQREISLLGGISALLSWDQMTYMPMKGANERAEQSSLISRLMHDKIVSDEFYDHIIKLSDDKTLKRLTKHDRIILERLKKDVEKARKIPSDYIKRSSRIISLSYNAWQTAKKKKNYRLFSPYLKKILELEQEYYDYIKLPGHPYNTLLDDYEEGMTVERLKTEFKHIKKQIVDLLENIKTSKTYEKQKPIKGLYPQKKQHECCLLILQHMMLKPDESRLDTSAHPFTIQINDNDVRITTRYNKYNPLSSFYSTIHEAGHALYDLGLPQGVYKDTVISEAPSVGLHESQSRFWENMIGKSKDFCYYWYPILKKMYPDNPDIKKNQDIGYQIVNQVKPSPIRVEADELTYSLHIILRFEIELLLINDKITINEIPDFWNDKMIELLGVKPKNDAEGVLQDMHWSTGDIGYFPTYLIGSIYAAQIHKQLLKEQPDTPKQIRKGDYQNIIKWLRTHIHRYGRTLTSDQIIKKTCHEGLNADTYIKYLKDKYTTIYNL